LDENAIMLQVIQGDTGKLGILYERYKRPMYGYFFKLTGGDQPSSEDLVHSVFFKALKYKHSFKGTGSFAKWIFSIAHNLGIDYTRKKRRAVTVELNSDYHGGEQAETPGLEKGESLSLLHIALDMLGDEDKEILVLGKIRELKYSEIAEITGLTVSAVKTRIFRALKRLREVYLKIETTRYEKQRIG